MSMIWKRTLLAVASLTCGSTGLFGQSGPGAAADTALPRVVPADSSAAAASEKKLAGGRTSAEVARAVDDLILKQLAGSGTPPAAKSADEDFLRRVSLDLTGHLPGTREVTLFGIDPDARRRERAIEQLLTSDAFAENWARYWRDVIFSRATNARSRLAHDSFLDWMTTALRENRSWDQIATGMITATGIVVDNGATALVFAQEAEPENVAGEVSRIFLGIQMQCANCHDHPWDRWKRDEFHQLAAFFPRVGIRQQPMDFRSYELVAVNASMGEPGARFEQMKAGLDRIFQFADRNRDGRLARDEATGSPLERPFDLMLNQADKDKDGMLSKTEIREMPPPMMQEGRGSTEHFMPDLNNPAAQGRRMEPKLFLTSLSLKAGASDADRRESFARSISSDGREWFSKAFVNRMWTELTGDGFYTPVDDMGPDRKARLPEVLDLLSAEFVHSGYDVRWLMRTIVLSDTYQRRIQSAPAEESPSFAAASHTRLRGDQLYSSLVSVTGIEPQAGFGMQRGGGGPGPRASTPRDRFAQVFGFDPSTPQADLTGTIPQALYLMNGPWPGNQIRATGGTRLAALLTKYSDNGDALGELYLLVLSREPSDRERKVCLDHIASVGNREEAFEDLMWSLVNSSEFLTKR